MCFPCFPGDLWNPSNKCPWRAPGLALQWLAPGSPPLWVQSCSIDLPSSHSIWTGQRRTIWRSDAFASKLKRWPRGEHRTRSNLYNQVFEGVDHNLKKKITFQTSWRGEEAAWFYPHLCKAECKASVDCPYDERLLPPYRSWHRHCLPRWHLWVDYKCTHSCPGESFSQKRLWFHLKNMKSLFYMAEQNWHFICANIKNFTF